MSKFESMDFEDISDDDFSRQKKTEKSKPIFDPDKISPEEVIGSFSRQISKNPEEKLIAEEEAKEAESLLRSKYNIPEWVGLEEIARRIQAGENLGDLEDAAKEAIKVEEDAQLFEKNKFRRELALNGGEIIDVENERGEKIPLTTDEEVNEVIPESKEDILSKKRVALTAKKDRDTYENVKKGESHVPKRKRFKGAETIKTKLKV